MGKTQQIILTPSRAVNPCEGGKMFDAIKNHYPNAIIVFDAANSPTSCKFLRLGLTDAIHTAIKTPEGIEIYNPEGAMIEEIKE